MSLVVAPTDEEIVGDLRHEGVPRAGLPRHAATSVPAKPCNACHVAPRASGKRNTWCTSCKSAWQRAYRAGERKQKRVPAPIRDESGCLLWQGEPDENGYGRITVDGASIYAHRAAYEAAHGPLSDGETVDHLCEVKLCVERSHLEACSRGENVRRYYQRRQQVAA